MAVSVSVALPLVIVSLLGVAAPFAAVSVVLPPVLPPGYYQASITAVSCSGLASATAPVPPPTQPTSAVLLCDGATCTLLLQANLVASETPLPNGTWIITYYTSCNYTITIPP